MWGLMRSRSAIQTALDAARASVRRAWKGAQQLVRVRHLGGLFQRAGDRRLADVALHVDVEEVLPGLALHGPRLDRIQVHAVAGEGLEQSIERAALILAHREDRRGQVVAAGRRRLASDHQEAGGVEPAVLDAALDDPQAVDPGRDLAADRRHLRVRGRKLGRRSGARRLDDLDARQIALQPVATLGQGLGVRGDAGDVAHLPALGQQRLGDLQQQLAADRDLARHQPVEGLGHGALDRVLDRHHAEVRLAALGQREDLRDRCPRTESAAPERRTAARPPAGRRCRRARGRRRARSPRASGWPR